MANRNTNKIKLKRSNVSGKIPTLGQLELGEVALNTADGKLYTEYTGGATGSTEVREIGWNRVNVTGDTMSGPLYGPIISATTISATTFYGDGSNLTGISGSGSVSFNDLTNKTSGTGDYATTGKLGIGTSSPAGKLHVSDSVDSGGVISLFGNTTSNGYAEVRVIEGTTGAGSRLSLLGYGASWSPLSTWDRPYAGAVVNNRSGGLSLAATHQSGLITFHTGTDNTERLRIATNGDISVLGNIISTNNNNINIIPNGTGNVSLGNLIFDADQTVGAGEDNYVLTYDNATGLISLEAAAGGGGGGHEIYSQTGTTALPQQPILRFEGYLRAVDDPISGETKVDLDPTKTSQFNSTNIIDVNGVMELSLDQNKIYMGNANNLAEQKTLTQAFSGATTPLSTTMFHVVAGQTELFVPQGYIITGDINGVGYADTVANALSSNAVPTSSIFKVDISGNVALNVPTGYIIRGDANGDGIAEPLISGSNKILATDNSGNEYEADLVNYLDLLTASGVTSNGILNTFDLSGTARGVLGGYKITDVVIENTTANVVTINIGSINGGNDIANNVEIGANDFIDVLVGKALFSKTTEQDLYASSSNWNSADLIIKISVKKVY